MKKLIAISIIVLALALGTAIWLNARNTAPKSNSASSPPKPGLTTVTPDESFVLTPGPMIGTTTANPSIIAVNTPTAVTVTSVITDPSVIPTGVNLLRLNANGTSTVLGQLKDDGTNGDVVAGDKTFTIVKTFNEPATGEIKLQGSAAFRGLLKRLVSGLVMIQLWHLVDNSNAGYSILFPPGFELSHTTSISHGTPIDEMVLSSPTASGETSVRILSVELPTPINSAADLDINNGSIKIISQSLSFIAGRESLISEILSPGGAFIQYDILKDSTHLIEIIVGSDIDATKKAIIGNIVASIKF